MPEELSKTRAMKAPPAIVGHKFFLLFVFLLGYLIVYPYTQNSTAGFYMFRVLAIAITVLCVYAVSFRRSLVLFGVTLAIPVLLDHLQILRADASALSILNISLTFAFDALII